MAPCERAVERLAFSRSDLKSLCRCIFGFIPHRLAVCTGFLGVRPARRAHSARVHFRAWRPAESDVPNMSPKTRKMLLRLALVPVAAAVLAVAGCTSGSMTNTGTQSTTTGSTFVVGTDAPMASVISFQVTVSNMYLNPTGGGTPVSMISGSPSVDFARFNGLQPLLDMNAVPTGTYDSVTIDLGTGTIGYLNTTTPPPTISTMPVPYTNGSSA